MIQKKYAELSAWNAKLKANTRDYTQKYVAADSDQRYHGLYEVLLQE